MRFDGKVVWVTGASSGIGEALAHAFHAEGARMVLSARREDELVRVRDACLAVPVPGAGDVMVLPMDLADAPSLAGKVAQVQERCGHIDILVNNAGITQRSLVADTAMEVYRTLFEVNFFGAIALTKLVLPSMIARRSGHMVVVTSVVGKYATPLRSGYAASKHALHGFFDALRAEVWPHDIAVTLVVPGGVRTNISINALRGDGSRHGRMDRFLEHGPAAKDCARAILDAVHRRREEMMFATGRARSYATLKRFFPGWFSRMIRDRRAR